MPRAQTNTPKTKTVVKASAAKKNTKSPSRSKSTKGTSSVKKTITKKVVKPTVKKVDTPSVTIEFFFGN